MPESETEQALFWKGEFGDQYTSRNRSRFPHESNIHFFSKVLASVQNEINSVLELGANSGSNFLALRELIPDISYTGVEINRVAAEELRTLGPAVIQTSIESFDSDLCWDLVFTKGVLIHLNPASLASTYEKMVRLSSKFLVVAEYFSPDPIPVSYRGETDRLFKRDFAGEILDRFASLSLRDYGFSYDRGPFPQDNISWFLLEKI